MSRPEANRCLLQGCNQRVFRDSAYCTLSHASEAVKRGQADACVYCKNFAKTPGFPTCSKVCGGLLALERQSNGPSKTSHQYRPYSGSYPAVTTNTGPRAPDNGFSSKQSIRYPCGCTVMTHVANPPPNCPFCHASGSGRAPQGGYTPSGQNPASVRNADPFKDHADAALALADPRRQSAGGFRPPPQPVSTSGRPQAPKAFIPRNVDPLAGSDDEGGYATPSDVALPDSPVVETTSGSDSVVLVNYSGASRSDTMRSAPPAYDDTDWTKVEPPSGRSSPAKDQTLRSPVYQKKLPDIPPRRKGLFGRRKMSSETPTSSNTAGQESGNSSSTLGTPGAEPPAAVNAGPLGRPKNSNHPALSPLAQPDASSFPVFPSAPTNALGISENAEGAGKPLVIADPKAGGGSEAFSNEDPLPIEYKKKIYPSGEHLYHAMKFMDTRPLLAEHIRECTDPKDEAARFSFEQNPGWDQMCVQKMEEVVQLKCKQHSTFKNELRETGDTHIFFSDPDPFWGTGPDGSGQNQFGEVLMRVRATLGKGRLTKSLGLK